jgi:SAM-dependent methyltransferase
MREIRRISKDEQNSEFWDTLCGTNLAVSLGITDRSLASLRKFDDWYFNFYPYLAKHIPFESFCGRRVLEVGLGYGSVAQRIAESGAAYVGLDIANGPVEMANHRLCTLGLDGCAQVGSILQAPFASEIFDYVVAIGCYHHTGDLQGAIDETYRVLRPGGTLIFMVYNAYSYRRWVNNFQSTFTYLLRDHLGFRLSLQTTESERAAYDADSTGRAAPHTDFISRHAVRRMCRRYSSFAASLENIDQERPFQQRTRAELMRTKWPRFVGLDIYGRAVK